MTRTTFHIAKMDCPAEEQLVRMSLAPVSDVEHLTFDLDRREVAVDHQGDVLPVLSTLAKLRLGESLVSSEEASAPTSLGDEEHTQRRMLWWVLGINAAFFVLEMTYGWVSGSMGLIADSLDMLADALVYGLALVAIGTTAARKSQVARISGYLQLTLAAVGFVEVLRRFFGTAEVPEFRTMIVVASLALVGNVVCLWLLRRTRSEEAHLQASVIFTSNDVAINAGVILSGVLVFVLESPWPDLVIGGLIFLLLLQGSRRILRLANNQQDKTLTSAT